MDAFRKENIQYIGWELDSDCHIKKPFETRFLEFN